MDETLLTIPLVLGVTGHRDLLTEEIPAIKSSAKKLFLQLQETFPDLPILLISPLAEGADQVIAEVAFEMGIPVTALLPMPLALYQDDFSGPALEAFNQLLAAVRRATEHCCPGAYDHLISEMPMSTDGGCDE